MLLVIQTWPSNSFKRPGHARNEKDKECLRDLCITDPERDKFRLQQRGGNLFRATYAWVFDDRIFKKWRINDCAGLLWTRGSPGTGKTTLLCSIIDELEQQPATTVAYFFCQATNRRLNSATNVLRGLIYTLVRRHPTLISHVRPEYDHIGQDAFTGIQAWTHLPEILTRILGDPILDSIILVVDALDECEQNLDKLIDLIVTLPVSPRVRWLVSSRALSSIHYRLEETPRKLATYPLDLGQHPSGFQAYVQVKCGHPCPSEELRCCNQRRRLQILGREIAGQLPLGVCCHSRTCKNKGQSCPQQT